MNILEVEDMIKGLPDQALQQEAQAPTGQVPQFLVISEIQRRTDMRKRFQQEQQPQGTVADQIVQEGVMSAMPPQAMPPQGMPPQQMFSGGIIRLQEGGFLGQQTASGAGTVRSQVERALQEGASMADLLTIFRNQPEAIELVKQLVADRQRASVDRYMPNFSEIDATKKDPDMPPAPEDTSEGLASLGAMTGVLPPEYDQQVAERRAGIADFFGNLSDQFAEGRARDMEFLNRRSSLVSAPQSKPANVQGESPVQAQAVSKQGGDPILANILNSQMVDPYMPSALSMPESVLGDEPVKESLAQEDAPDALKNAMNVLTSTAGPDASNPERESPLDFSDLIKESKDAAMANALMQLGAGIAGGDLSKGISAAGVAAAKGQQDARAMAIRKRLAEYQAGREDIAREEKGRQFDEQMELLEKKIDATLTASTATSQRENLRALAGEVASLRENFNIMSDSEKAQFKMLEQQLYSMLGIDMPQADVLAGLSGKDTKGLAEFLR